MSAKPWMLPAEGDCLEQRRCNRRDWFGAAGEGALGPTIQEDHAGSRGREHVGAQSGCYRPWICSNPRRWHWRSTTQAARGRPKRRHASLQSTSFGERDSDTTARRQHRNSMAVQSHRHAPGWTREGPWKPASLAALIAILADDRDPRLSTMDP